MTAHEIDRSPMEEPLASLERVLIRTYVTAMGHDLDALSIRTDPEARELLAAASRHASATLSEVEARWHFLKELHGQP